MSAKKFNTRIILPSKTLIEKEVGLVNAPGDDGIFGVLAEHSNFVSALKVGILQLFTNETSENYFIYGGICEVRDNSVNIITEFAADIGRADKNVVNKEISSLKDDLLKEHQDEANKQIINNKITRLNSLLEFI